MNDETVDYINQQLEILADSLPSSFSSLNVYLTVSSFMEKKEEAEGLVLALCHILSSCSPDFASYRNCSDVEKVKNHSSRFFLYVHSFHGQYFFRYSTFCLQLGIASVQNLLKDCLMPMCILLRNSR